MYSVCTLSLNNTHGECEADKMNGSALTIDGGKFNQILSFNEKLNNFHNGQILGDTCWGGRGEVGERRSGGEEKRVER